MVTLIMNMLSKRLAHGFTLVLALSLTACGDDAGETNSTSDSEASSTTTGTTLGTTGSSETSDGSSATTGERETTSSSGATSTAVNDTDAPSDVTVLEGFSTPESVHWHAASESWFVSNIAGETGVPDGEGWISRLDTELGVTQMQWFDGLNSPAGLASNETTLFVADLDRVLAINIATGTLAEEWAVRGAGLLNDPAIHSDASVYVSDTFANAIYRLRSDEAPALVLQD
ncbi:MAG: hypothetical protein KUG77_28650, partial [Nannocystaceae bacterium]|nr:hypothetical protein [Nannocystaceae bacterium]